VYLGPVCVDARHHRTSRCRQATRPRRSPKLFDVPRVKDGWLPDVLARLQIRYREIPVVFADSRKFAEEWTYRFLATAVADRTAAGPGAPDGGGR